MDETREAWYADDRHAPVYPSLHRIGCWKNWGIPPALATALISLHSFLKLCLSQRALIVSWRKKKSFLRWRRFLLCFSAALLSPLSSEKPGWASSIASSHHLTWCAGNHSQFPNRSIKTSFLPAFSSSPLREDASSSFISILSWRNLIAFSSTLASKKLSNNRSHLYQIHLASNLKKR